MNELSVAVLRGMATQREEVQKRFPATPTALFRWEGEYVAVDEDASNMSEVLGLEVIQWEEGVWLAFSLEKLEFYLRSLLRAGYRVVICDQVEDKG